MARRIAAAIWVCFVLIAAVSGTAFAKAENILRLPRGLQKIETESFSGLQDIDKIVVSEGLERIDARAFTGSDIGEIQLPKSLRSIDDAAFEGCEGMLLRVKQHSYAHLWCIERGLDFKLQANASMVEISGVPSCWKKHMNTRIKDIFAALSSAGENRSAFFWYTDSHWSENFRRSPGLLRYLTANTPINKTNFGGDVIALESKNSKDMAYLMNWRRAVNAVPNHHSVVGNHDDGNGSKIADGSLSVDYIHSFLMDGEDRTGAVSGGEFSYYMDDAAEKTRYIYLDMGTRYYSYLRDGKQREFLRQALKSAKNGWHVVVIGHAWHDVDYTSNTAGVKGFSDEGLAVLEVLDAYNARSGEFAGCGAWVEFCMGGHTHIDGDYTSKGGIPVVITECDSTQVRSGLKCEEGTITEASVNAVVADYDAGELHIIRIGRGKSRTVSLQKR